MAGSLSLLVPETRSFLCENISFFPSHKNDLLIKADIGWESSNILVFVFHRVFLKTAAKIVANACE